MAQSRTPIADQVRGMEHKLNELKHRLDEVLKTRDVVKDHEAVEYCLVDPMLSSDIRVSKRMYIFALDYNEKVLKEDIAALEAKLTTVYAALNDCLGDS